MRDFIEELINSESPVEVLRNNRAQTVKLALAAVLLLGAVLFLICGKDEPLELTDESADRSAREATVAEQTQPETAVDTDGVVYVDIGGAVQHPMLAELPAGSRVEDAIEAAGGLEDDADLARINRAAVVSDGQKIYIPQEGESAPQESDSAQGLGAAGQSAGSSAADLSAAGISEGRININTADVTLLQQLTGVGPVTAQKIVDWRQQNGNFETPEDLMKVPGIGEKTFEKMRDDVTV